MSTSDLSRKGIGVLALITCLAFAPCAYTQTIDYVPAPTGVPETDWQNIQNTINAMGPGDTLQLAQGTYRVHRPLSLVNWNGSFVGAGSDKTTLQVSKASNGDLFAVVYAPEWDDADFQGMRFFETPVFKVYNAHGLFRIADLTIDVTEEGVAERSYALNGNTGEIQFYVDVWKNNNSALINGALGAEVDVIIENCSFLGAAQNQSFGQPNHGIQLSGQFFNTVGDYSVTNSHFNAIGTNVVNPIAMHESNIVIEGNTFIDSASPMVLWNNSACTADIRDNYASNVFQAAVMIQNINTAPAPTDPCVISVRGLQVEGGGGVFWYLPWSPAGYVGAFTDNDIKTKTNSSWAGFELWDGGSSVLTVANNKIHSENSAFFGPVFTLGTHGAAISGNKITGSGPAAMYLGAWPFSPDWPSEDTDMLVHDNDVLDFKPKAHAVLAGGACCSGVIPSHYWLGLRTNSNTIIGQDATSDRVFDTGTNNTVQSAIHIQQGIPDAPPGQSILDKESALAVGGIRH